MKPRRRITLSRRIIQLACLILLVYGGYLFKGRLAGQEANVGEPPGTGGSLFPDLKAPKGAMSTTQFAPGSILWPSGATPVLENYPPTLVCRFNPKGGLFKACIVHFFSENFTWQTHLKYLLPHLTLFVLLCFLLGRFWCGWVCPIGSLGDLLSWLRRRMNVPVRRFPAGFRNALVFSSYGLLGATLGISTFIGLPNYSRFQCYWFLPYCQICPARLVCPVFGLIKPGWKDFTNGVSATFTLLAWLVLGLFVAAFYWGRRVWCHLCPVGLVNSWFNRGAGLELHKKAVKCNKCGYCADACPMGLTAMYEADTDRKYNQNGCIMCLRCLEVCPKDGCLSCRFFGRRVLESRY
ncbi:MAG TPA: 4Fe-4S binding protein [bacterium]|uniref:Putative electron transport protein YccM n=1 Tax=candidate division TA06 bacterium ADurb.Bin417 TaxID=1852828 RepID=A0A1V5MHE6_UNCT6|nr:MAG: putative electron transport protein YccM [candidate division TA06 bacterium ADurb.Bin417]HNQ34876.1 4Fe-4S binding protein [bacterium]HNS48920.1 4Fe-4S binding protein [bacterium]